MISGKVTVHFGVKFDSPGMYFSPDAAASGFNTNIFNNMDQED